MIGSTGLLIGICLSLAHSFRVTNSFVLRRPAIIQNVNPYVRVTSVQRSTSRGFPRPPISTDHHQFNVGPLPMVAYQDLMEKIPSKEVIDAVEGSTTGKVVASDIAASAGVSLSQARKDLTALASLTRGGIAVDKDGELIYSFPSNLKGALANNSAKYRAQQAFSKAWPAVFWLVRVSFGVTLLASLFAIFSTIFFLSSSSSSSDDDRRRDDDRGGGIRFFGSYNPFWGPSPFDFFYYRPYGYYSYGQPERDPDEMGFFESVFSYVFGDGDVNAGLEEKRLALVANLIRQNNGAVTAEQLAPFCDDAPVPSELDSQTYIDESFVLPIVTALSGEPRVTDDGDIIYVFPELQKSASSAPPLPILSNEAFVLKRAGLSPEASAMEIKTLLNYNGISTRGAIERRDLVRLLEKALPPLTEDEESELLQTDSRLLQEREWKFSVAPELNKFLAGALGVINLGGALYLGNMLGQAALLGVRLPSYFGLVQTAFPFLLAYAVLFNVLPLARTFWIRLKNDAIRKRNTVRRYWRAAIAGSSQDSRIGRKLKTASLWGSKLKQVGAEPNDIIYNTKDPFGDTIARKEQSRLDEFDKLLGSDDPESILQ